MNRFPLSSTLWQLHGTNEETLNLHYNGYDWFYYNPAAPHKLEKKVPGWILEGMVKEFIQKNQGVKNDAVAFHFAQNHITETMLGHEFVF